MPNDFNGCDQYQQRVVAQLRQLLGGASITQPSNDTVLVVGRHVGSLPVTNNQIAIGCASALARDAVVDMRLLLWRGASAAQHA